MSETILYWTILVNQEEEGPDGMNHSHIAVFQI